MQCCCGSHSVSPRIKKKGGGGAVPPFGETPVSGYVHTTLQLVWYSNHRYYTLRVVGVVYSIYAPTLYCSTQSYISCLFCRKKPNLIVHLDVSPEESKRRIEMRRRDCESTISLDYLTNLHAAYEEFIKDISRIIPVIRVNYERFRSADEMADMIVRLGIIAHFEILYSGNSFHYISSCFC